MHTCDCGQVFDEEGTLHGQPASLWRMLEHQATGCPGRPS